MRGYYASPFRNTSASRPLTPAPLPRSGGEGFKKHLVATLVSVPLSQAPPREVAQHEVEQSRQKYRPKWVWWIGTHLQKFRDLGAARSKDSGLNLVAD